MYFYHHLGKGGGKYVERPDGLPVIYSDRIIIPLTANQAQQPFTDLVRLLTQYVAVGLWVEKPDATAAPLINEVLKVAPAAVYNTAYMTLKDNTATLLNALSMRRIQQANDNGMPYYVTPAGFINLSESKLEVWNNAAITNGVDAIVINVDYVIPLAKHLADVKNKNI